MNTMLGVHDQVGDVYVAISSDLRQSVLIIVC